jgi:opacity protein-like surface antigen
MPSRKSTKFSITPGIGIKRPFTTRREINIVPELHFNVTRICVLIKNATMMLDLGKSDPIATIAKLANTKKTSYNVGGYVNINKSDNVQVGIGYDYNFRKSFSNHSSYASLYIKF